MLLKDQKDYSLKDIPVCVGRNKRFRKSPRLYKGLVVLFGSRICDSEISVKNKSRIIRYIFSLFYRNPIAFKLSLNLNNNNIYYLGTNDSIALNAIFNLASLKKFFKIIDMEIIDYKKIKRKKYSFNFIFFINNENSEDNNILLDITNNEFGVFQILICINSFFFIKDLIQLIFFYYNNYNKKN
jgi:hypothetical protein